MKLKEKKLSGGKISLEAHATVDEVSNAFGTAYFMFVKSMGLQPEQGKTVNDVAKEKLGIDDLDAQTRDNALQELVALAIDKSGLLPAYPAKVTKSEAFHRGHDTSFTLEVMPKVHYELTSYDPVSITVPPFEMDMSAVDQQLEQLAARNTEYVRAAEQHEVREGDAVLLEMESTSEGERMPGLSYPKRTYIVSKGFMPAGFDEQLLGMQPGETKSFEFEGPSIDDAGNECTQKVQTTVTVLELQEETIPAITDAWVQRYMPMYKSVEDMRASITKSLEAQQRESYEAYCRQIAIAALAERFEGRIPDEAYEAMRETIMGDMAQACRQQGITLKEYMEQVGGEQQFSMMTMLQVRSVLTQGYVLDALFEHEKLKVTDADYIEAAKQVNPQANPMETRKQLEANNRNFILKETAQRVAATNFLMEHANITVEGE